MKYDDASWHSEGDFPPDLPHEAGATHAGMFLAWALQSGLAGEFHLNENPEEMSKLEARSITPGAFFLLSCDGKLTDEDLNDEGNAFARAYFDFNSGMYLKDYEAMAGGSLPSLYHVPDTWETYDKLRPVLDRRLAEWRGHGD